MSQFDTSNRPITIAIMAMGGQGGGVLANWLVDLAEHGGYIAQTTSVPGVAQRTGATIYYVELFPQEAARKAGREPVLALMPVPGDVDIVIAAEFMEVGRALQRGFITPERTTVIASSHRVYGISEKMAMGDGVLDPEPIRMGVQESAKSFIHFDMEAAAEAQGSVISAVLFGAVAGSDALPFPREAFADAIRRGGIGVEASLRAFDAGERQARGEAAPAAPASTPGAEPVDPELRELVSRIETRLPQAVRFNAREGVRRLVDYQDPAYARDYLDRVEEIAALETEQGGGEARDYRISAETARHLALWMSYEDTIRVADLKTRAKRFKRVHDEVRAESDQIVYVTEFMHPRVEEICDTLPAGIGRWILNSPRVCSLLGRFTRRGRHIQTAKLQGFLLLYTLAGMRRWRRSTLRYAEERARINAWLERVRGLVPADPMLALEVVLCQRLVKGYGDTHARGLSSFNMLIQVLDTHRERSDIAELLRRLREAALADEGGKALRAALDELARETPAGQPVETARGETV
ncbi:MAG: indolepyruvate oxidoreductase subunit beta family protein [Aquisalimonadaceae bacterium]